MLSGGAESSIILWDLECGENTCKRFTYRPTAAIRKYEFGALYEDFQAKGYIQGRPPLISLALRISLFILLTPLRFSPLHMIIRLRFTQPNL